MKSELIAIPVFQDRVSPLLDEARRFAIYEICDGNVTQKILLNVEPDTDSLRICKLKDMGVTTVVCGAVSGNLSRFIVEKGIKHYPWVSGSVDEVIHKFINGELNECFAGKRRCEGGRKKRCCITWQEEEFTDNNHMEKD